MMSENESRVVQMHNKRESAIKHNKELSCPWADHVERSFLSKT